MEGYFIHIANHIEKLRRSNNKSDNNVPVSFTGKILQELKSLELWKAVLAEFIATFLFVFIGTMSAVGIVPVVDDWAKIVRKIIQELKSWELWKAVLAEFIATFLLVFIGTMSAVWKVPIVDEWAKNAGIAFTFGLMIAVCIQMIGHVSGGHMNPAVSLAMAVAMEITPSRAVLYTIAQCLGGILGSLLLKGVTPSRLHDNLGLTSVNSDLSEAQGFVCEMVFTFILVMSIFGTTDPNRALFGSPALGIGLTVGVMHFAGIPFTGASMNPARSLASSVISTGSNTFDKHWVYWVGPILGGIIAAIVYKYLFNPYRGKMTVAEATNKMMQSSDMVVIPRSYFNGNMNSDSEGKGFQSHHL